MNIDSIDKDFEEMIKTELLTNPALYHLYRTLNDAGLNNSCDNSDQLAKAFCLMLVGHNKNLKEQLLKAHANSVRPLFITTPESQEDFFKRTFAEISDPTWKIQSELASERMKIYQSLAIDPDKLSQDIGSAAHEMRMKRQQYLLSFPSSFCRGVRVARELKGDRLYLAETREPLESPDDLAALIVEAKESTSFPVPLVIEVSPKAHDHIKDLVERELVFKANDTKCGNELCGMRVKELIHREDYFIGILHDLIK
ncbi:hypothetical protein [Vibrio parahaemolyticus]|uniref:hypothetical protein n=1 Tax=Vibrio parahaemolyticus TaxID=670 RepID=UPI00387B0247